MTHSKHKLQLDEFVSNLNKELFYDAHESLELIWFPRRFEPDNEIKLLKGFINAAVSFELIKRGRYESSKKVWKNYLKYKTLLYEIDSPHIIMYHNISQYLENIHRYYLKVKT